jgi:ATP-dependent Clp protease ATP-binding subunit ClpA
LENLKGVCRLLDVVREKPEIIVFSDEIHLLIGNFVSALKKFQMDGKI